MKTFPVIDGGELFNLRSQFDFAQSYAFRKLGIASKRVDSPFIPAQLRDQWSAKVGVSFGIYDVGTNPKELRTTLANALRVADAPVWFYTETFTCFTDGKGGAPKDWLDAIRGAREDAGKGTLIYDGRFGIADANWIMARPAWVAANIKYLDTLPFDGIVISAVLPNYPESKFDPRLWVLSDTPVALKDLADCLAPLANLKSKRLTNNHVTIQAWQPPDVFDDWTVAIQNCANLARALKSVGINSIYFDNEQYIDAGGKPWAWYEKQQYADKASLAEYQDQTYLRGKQVMEAMLGEHPGISIMALHGPYVSEWKVPASFPQWQSGNQLLGPFTAGMASGVK